MLKHQLLLLYSWLIRTLLFFFPDAPIVMRFRGFLYSLGMKNCGKNFQVTHNAVLNTIEKISVGNDVFLALNSFIAASREVHIKNEVLIGPNVVVVDSNHKWVNNSYRFGYLLNNDTLRKKDEIVICIEEGCWIGANCTIITGSRLPPGSVLGACSFLNKKFEFPNSLYGGVPAKFIKTYDRCIS